MKKILIYCSAILFANFCFSQPTLYSGNGSLSSNRTVTLSPYSLNFVPASASPTVGNFFISSTGNIGLGTTTPTSRFHLNSGDMSITAGNLSLGAGNANLTSGRLVFGTVANFNDATANWGIKSQRPFLIASTTYPLLEIRSTDPTAYGFANFAVATVDNGYSNVSIKGDIVLRGYTAGSLIFNADGGSDMKFTTRDVADKVRMRIDKYGKIGIGMENSVFPTNTLYSNYKLFVTGGILTDEIRVVLSSGGTWADYVFEDNYKLKPLDEIEMYIKENGHLPNVPSAKEVKDDGINIGEMVKIQQEKIEELTLYLIQQNKQLEALKEQVKILMERK